MRLKVCPATVQAEVYSTEQNHMAELLRGDTVGGAQGAQHCGCCATEPSDEHMDVEDGPGVGPMSPEPSGTHVPTASPAGVAAAAQKAVIMQAVKDALRTHMETGEDTNGRKKPRQ